MVLDISNEAGPDNEMYLEDIEEEFKDCLQISSPARRKDVITGGA